MTHPIELLMEVPGFGGLTRDQAEDELLTILERYQAPGPDGESREDREGPLKANQWVLATVSRILADDDGAA